MAGSGLAITLVVPGVLLPAGCLSPALPLPPPDRPDVAQMDQGLVKLSGRVPDVRVPVIAFNHDMGLFAGQVAGDEGEYSFELRAQTGDRVELWYEPAGDRSISVEFVIREPLAPAPGPPQLTVQQGAAAVDLVGTVPRPYGDVIVENVRTGLLSTVRADQNGSYQLAVPAQAGDVLKLRYRYGDKDSPFVYVTVP